MDERISSESQTAPAPELAQPAAAVAAPLSPQAAHDVGCACAGCSPAWSPANVLALQRGAGNAAVARSIAPRNVLARVIDDRPYNEGREARDTWIAGGKRGPIDHAPSTGRGGFSATYDPAAQELVIELRGGVEFKDGLDMWFGRFVVAQQPDSAPAQAAAQAINALPVDQRRAAMAPWLWTAAGKTTFLSELESSIEQAWRAKHQFHCSKEFWTDLGSTVDVRVVVHEGAQGSGDHMKVTSYKESDTVVNSGPAYVAPTEVFGSHDADDNEMVLTSNQTRRRSDIRQSVQIGFKDETTELDASSISQLNWFGNAYKSGGGPRCSKCSQEIAEAAQGAVNVEIDPPNSPNPQDAARARFNAVTAQLVSAGMTDAPTRCVMIVRTGTGNGGQVRMGAGVQQIVAAHEAGHMFGLDDEYTAPFSGTGGALGTPRDGDLGPAQGLPGAVAENSDTIMSVGDAVRPQHYATFLEALKAVTAMPEWVYGAPVPVTPPNPALDSIPGQGGVPAPTGEPTAVA